MKLKTKFQRFDPNQNSGGLKIQSFELLTAGIFLLDRPFEVGFAELFSTNKYL
jgi:hypothetical protein